MRQRQVRHRKLGGIFAVKLLGDDGGLDTFAGQQRPASGRPSTHGGARLRCEEQVRAYIETSDIH